MVFRYESLPHPKWMKSPRTVFVLFAIVYFFLLFVLLLSYFYHIKKELGPESDLKVVIDTGNPKPEVGGFSNWLINAFGVVNLISHSIASTLIGYGLYFVMRDSYRMRHGYPLHHPRGPAGAAQSPTGNGTGSSRRAKKKYYSENTVTSFGNVPSTSGVQLLSGADCRQATTIVIHQ